MLIVCRNNSIEVIHRILNIVEASRGPGAQSVTVNATNVGLIPTRGNEIFNIFISLLFS